MEELLDKLKTATTGTIIGLIAVYKATCKAAKDINNIEELANSLTLLNDNLDAFTDYSQKISIAIGVDDFE
jgi:hypothetical protein